MATHFGFEIPSKVESIDHIPSWTDGRICDILIRYAKNAQTIVEIGSWKGKSACTMAAVTSGLVYCVDTWMGGADKDTEEAMLDPIGVYRQFLAYVQHFGLSHKIVPVCQSSATAWQLFRERCIDLLYIDGDHRYFSVLNDLTHWVQFVRFDGIICGDDYGVPGVNMGVNAFAKLHSIPIQTEVDGKFWILRLEGL